MSHFLNVRTKLSTDVEIMFRVRYTLVLNASFHILRKHWKWGISFRPGGHFLPHLFVRSRIYSSSERQPCACVVPLPSTLRNSSGKSEPQSGVSSWLGKQNISCWNRLGLPPFGLRLSSQPILHPPLRHSVFGKSGPRNCVGETKLRRSIRKVKLLGKINNLSILRLA